jgi:hypothetical protein
MHILSNLFKAVWQCFLTAKLKAVYYMRALASEKEQPRQPSMSYVRMSCTMSTLSNGRYEAKIKTEQQ